MFTTLILTSCLLAAEPSAETSPWKLAVRPTHGQEFVYRGSVQEIHPTQTSQQFSRTYRLEARAFVLEAKENATNFAFLTILKQESPVINDPHAGGASVRLEEAEVDSLGRLIVPDPRAARVSMESPTTWENGFLVEFPPNLSATLKQWAVPDGARRNVFK